MLEVKWYDERLYLAGMHHVHSVCFPHEGWRRRDLRQFVDSVGCIAKAVVNDGQVVGSLLFHSVNDRIVIDRLGVLPSHRRRGAASFAVQTLMTARTGHGRRWLTACVREHNLAAQLLLKSLGFAYAYTDESLLPCETLVETDSGVESLEDQENAYWFRYQRDTGCRKRRSRATAAA